jgi:hypothetical protein
MNILRHVDLTRVFFVDIETVPGHATHAELPAAHQPLWKKFCEKRHAKELEAGLTHEELFANGGLYAEFGKVVCISVGYFRMLKDDTLEFRTKSFADDDECEVLRSFGHFLQRYAPYGPARYNKLETAGPMVAFCAPTTAASSTMATWAGACSFAGRKYRPCSM